MSTRRQAIEELRRIATSEGRSTLEDIKRELDAIWDILLDEAGTLEDREGGLL